MMRSICLILSLGLTLMSAAAEQSDRRLNLMPIPSSFQFGDGQMMIDQSFSVAIVGYDDARIERGVQRFLLDLSRQTGMPLSAHPGSSNKPELTIWTERASKEIQEPGEDESYALEVSATGATLSAPTPLGTLHGLQTFLQLVETTPSGFAAPAITIHDVPRFQWRGLMIDVSRHFIPIDVLERNLDGMAAVKMNVFHWHLSDDQGFRAESKRFPKLQEMGSDGLYYTQDQIRNLIGYARDRGIRVIPEFDMPGHSTAWFVGYPNLASAPGPYSVERNFGIFDPAMDPTQDQTYTFLDQFIDEMVMLFPDAYFHIGGDEVNGKQWEASPKIKQFMQAHGIKNNNDLQAYFNLHVQKILAKRGKTMIGWDEVLVNGLPKEVIIQSWRGQDSLAMAVTQGYRALLSSIFYLNLLAPASSHYTGDPMSENAAKLTPEQKERVLGGEAFMWTEFVSPENIDSRIWPRTAAIAERLWSPQSVRDADSMYRRMREMAWRLESLGLTHDSSYGLMLQRIAGSYDVSPLRTLADVAEPIKEYAREEPGQPPLTSQIPLNRLVDAVQPESEAAQRFSTEVESFVAGHCRDSASETVLANTLSLWRNNHAALQPMLNNSFLLEGVEPISKDLSELGAAGLEAMNYISRFELPPHAWTAERLALVEQSKKPHGQLLLMIGPTVRRLIDAASSGGSCQLTK